MIEHKSVTVESIEELKEKVNYNNTNNITSIIGSFSDNGVPFCYTVGAEIHIGAELIIWGLLPQYAKMPINTVVHLITKECNYQIEDNYIFKNINDTGFNFKVVECKDNVLDEYTFVLKSMDYKGKIYQILFEDESGIMQGDDGFALNYVEDDEFNKKINKIL